MKTSQMLISDPVGLHARPAALFVQTAQKYSANVSVAFNGKNANGKSLLSVLSLGVVQGSIISITVDGRDEDEALDSLRNLIEGNFKD